MGAGHMSTSVYPRRNSRQPNRATGHGLRLCVRLTKPFHAFTGIAAKRRSSMLQRIFLTVVVLGIPSLSRAQEGGARALPPGSQIYLRWDGFEKHRAAFDKTALGKMMAGDTGKFLKGMVAYIEKQFDALAGAGAPP